MSMRRILSFLVFTPLWAACNGTSTGNPMNDPPDPGQVPEGVELVKSEVAREVEPQLSAADAATLGVGNRAFAFDLYRELARKEGNLFLSPFSVSVALAMTYSGARRSTETEIKAALHFDLPQPLLHSAFNATLGELGRRNQPPTPPNTATKFDLRIVNQAWGQVSYPFLGSYLEVLARHYGAGLYAVDFAAPGVTRTINDWVEEQTEQRIKDLLPAGALSEDVRLVLTNAIYFKASWMYKFEVANTLAAVFHAAAGERTVSMMHQTLPARYAAGANYQALELPYFSPAMKMLLVLPAEGAFDSVVSGLNEAFFQGLRMRLVEHDATVGLPKFQFEAENPLSVPLSALGMPTAFSDFADFSGITARESLRIYEVYHKAFVAIDEAGTEAAAATAVVMGIVVSAKPQARITFDRPFVFAIYDEPTGQILFIGHLRDPG